MFSLRIYLSDYWGSPLQGLRFQISYCACDCNVSIFQVPQFFSQYTDRLYPTRISFACRGSDISFWSWVGDPQYGLVPVLSALPNQLTICISRLLYLQLSYPGRYTTNITYSVHFTIFSHLIWYFEIEVLLCSKYDNLAVNMILVIVSF